MADVGSCQTCPDLSLILKLIKQTEFSSKKNKETFKEKVLDTKDESLTFVDLMQKFTEENPSWKDTPISVPSAVLIEYLRNAHYHTTEEDIQSHLKHKYSEEIKLKKIKLHSLEIKRFINKIIIQLNDEEMSRKQAIEQLNEELLPIVFAGENTQLECKACKKKKCKRILCPVKRGFVSKLDIEKEQWEKKLWPEILDKADDSEGILKHTEEKCKNGLKKYLQSSPEYDLLASIRGQKSENNVFTILQSHLRYDDKPGLLIRGYRVFSSLKILLQSYGIKLKGSQNDNVQVEHDILTIIPVMDRVKVNFTQVKATMKIPWPHEANRIESIVSACKKAFCQVAKDFETFVKLMEYFLTKEEFEKVDLNFSISITSLECIPKDLICFECRSYIYEENKEYGSGLEKTKFGIANLTKPSKDSFEIFKILATVYIGGASLVELKTGREGYLEERTRMDLVKKGMTNMLYPRNQKGHEQNKIVQLGPEQNSILLSKIGLQHSYVIIAPWGGGKSILLQFELERTVELHNESEETVNIFLVVFARKATSLLQQYKCLVDDLDTKENINIQVMNLREVCELYSVKLENRDTTSLINELCKTMSYENKCKIYLYIDEVMIENPRSSTPEDLLGKVPFVLDKDVFPWSELDSHGVNLIACINPESQDLAQLQNLDAGTISQLKLLKPDQGPVPTIPMWRVFRSTNAITEFLQELKQECSKKHREFGYLIPPDMIIKGHEIRGDIPQWINVRQSQHMKCSKQNCGDCFLLCIISKFESVLENLKCNGTPYEDILVILSESSSTRRTECPYGTAYLRSRHPDLSIKSNFEFDGCEANVVIVIRNGGLLSYSLSNAISRAVSRLILFIPDDDQILQDCCRKGLLFCDKKLFSVNNYVGTGSLSPKDVSIFNIRKEFQNLINQGNKKIEIETLLEDLLQDLRSSHQSNENLAVTASETQEDGAGANIPEDCFPVIAATSTEPDVDDTPEDNKIPGHAICLMAVSSRNLQFQQAAREVNSYVVERNLQLQQLERLVKNHDEIYYSVNFGQEVLIEMILYSMFSINMSETSMTRWHDLEVRRIIKIVNDLEEFNNFSYSDKGTILEENLGLLVCMHGAVFFDRKKKGLGQLLSSIGADDLQFIETHLFPFWKELELLMDMDYGIKSKSEARTESEDRFYLLQSKVRDLLPDRVTMILMTYIVLVSSHYFSIQVHSLPIKMLEHYIYSKNPPTEAMSILANTLNLVTYLREMDTIQKSQKIKFNYFH